MHSIPNIMEDAEDHIEVVEDTEIIDIDYQPEDDDDEILADGDTNDEDEGAQEMDEIPDDADTVFTKHKGSVFCCDLDPVGAQLVVSGGEDDFAYVWNATNGDVMFQCTGHKDSVTCVAFSHDGTYVATGDMSGLIKVWKTSTGAEVWSWETSDLTWLEWHHSSHVLLSGNMDGELWMWRIPGGECKIFRSHGIQTDCGKIFPDGKRTAVGYGDGSVKLWDLKNGTALHNIAGSHAHTGSVTCLDCYQDNVLVLTGALDGTAKLINANSGKVVATYDCGDKSNEESTNSVECVGFCSSMPVCATGTLKGHLAIWDIGTQVQRQIHKHCTGIIRLVWDHVSPLIYTTGLDGAIQLWDARSGKQEAQWTGHSGEVLDMILSRDGSMIVTASDDKTCRIFNVNCPDR